MKDFNIAKYLKENHLGSHAILGAYVDLHNLKEEEEMELDTEIPYEGPEHKLDGFGDEFVQDNPVEEEMAVSDSGVEMEEAGGMDNDDSVNPFPSIVSDDEDDRFASLGGEEIKSAIKSLMDDGFEARDIAQFVVDTIRAFKK